MDALMDFSRNKYEHLLQIAQSQHIQMLRAWGGGMPETDDFYELCDKYGILVIASMFHCDAIIAGVPISMYSFCFVSDIFLKNLATSSS